MCIVSISAGVLATFATATAALIDWKASKDAEKVEKAENEANEGEGARGREGAREEGRERRRETETAKERKPMAGHSSKLWCFHLHLRCLVCRHFCCCHLRYRGSVALF